MANSMRDPRDQKAIWHREGSPEFRSLLSNAETPMNKYDKDKCRQRVAQVPDLL